MDENKLRGFLIKNNPKLKNKILNLQSLDGLLDFAVEKNLFRSLKKDIGTYIFGLSSFVEEYFPKAKVDTWPTALYEGVHKYDTASLSIEEYAVRRAVLDNFYSPEERAVIKSKINSGRYWFCEDLSLYIKNLNLIKH